MDPASKEIHAQVCAQNSSTQVGPSTEEFEDIILEFRLEISRGMVSLSSFVERINPLLKPLWVTGPHYHITPLYWNVMREADRRAAHNDVASFVAAFATYSSFYESAATRQITPRFIRKLQDKELQNFALERIAFCDHRHPRWDFMEGSNLHEKKFAMWQLRQKPILEDPDAVRRAVTMLFFNKNRHTCLPLDDVPAHLHSNIREIWSDLHNRAAKQRSQLNE